jgi:hypothetical protein
VAVQAAINTTTETDSTRMMPFHEIGTDFHVDDIPVSF